MHVEPDALRDAADKTRDASDLDNYDFDVDHVDPGTLGHLELTDWLLAVLGQCNNAGRALHAGVQEIAEALELTAVDIEDTDRSIAGSFLPFEPAQGGVTAVPVPDPVPPTPGTIPDYFTDLLHPVETPVPDPAEPVFGPPSQPTIRDILLGEGATTPPATNAPAEEEWHPPMVPPAEDEVPS